MTGTSADTLVGYLDDKFHEDLRNALDISYSKYLILGNLKALFDIISIILGPLAQSLVRTG